MKSNFIVNKQSMRFWTRKFLLFVRILTIVFVLILLNYVNLVSVYNIWLMNRLNKTQYLATTITRFNRTGFFVWGYLKRCMYVNESNIRQLSQHNAEFHWNLQFYFKKIFQITVFVNAFMFCFISYFKHISSIT